MSVRPADDPTPSDQIAEELAARERDEKQQTRSEPSNAAGSFSEHSSDDQSEDSDLESMAELVRQALAPATSEPSAPESEKVHEVMAIPAEIGRFRIRQEIGRGGFGIVLRAHDPRAGREVALRASAN